MNVVDLIDNNEVLVYQWVDEWTIYNKSLEEELFRLAKLGASMQWISVKEELPGQHVTVMILTKHASIWVNMSFIKDTEVFECSYFIDDNGYRYRIDEVTHWMIQPKPPKEGD